MFTYKNVVVHSDYMKIHGLLSCCQIIIYFLLELNIWLKEATPLKWIFATDWQMAVRRDDVISITLRQVY